MNGNTAGKVAADRQSGIGLALGGGGVRGLAHIPVLQQLDVAGLRPAALAGTSMGAIVAALYAAGKSGDEIQELVSQQLLTEEEGFREMLARKVTLLKWVQAVRVAWTGTGLLRADGFLHFLMEQMGVSHFEELGLPLRIVATDFHTGEAVIFSSGPLRPALEASMAIPGIFVPVEHEGRVLVDGGISNNLPYDLLLGECAKTIAVDVTPTRDGTSAEAPNMIDATLGMFDILVEHLTRCKLQKQAPDCYIHPRLSGVRVLEFDKAELVLEQAAESLLSFNFRNLALPSSR